MAWGALAGREQAPGQLLETLQTEYIHLLPLVQIGLAAATGSQTES